jgi:hypothetical protein
MSQFNISLPHNLVGTVRKGKISKIDFKVGDLLNFRRLKPQVHVGYIVQVDLAPGNKIIYQLSRTADGKWLSTNTDPLTQAVIHAIDKYETYQAEEMPERF